MNAHDDPKLTAYALGELPEAERIEVERMLEVDPALRAEVEAIRATAGQLAAELKAEPLPAGGRVMQQTVTPADPAPLALDYGRRSQGRRTRWILAAAASVAVAGLVLSLTRRPGTPLAINMSTAGAQPDAVAEHDAKQAEGKNVYARGAVAQDKDGQQFLFGDGNVEFETNPFTGVQRDNLATARMPNLGGVGDSIQQGYFGGKSGTEQSRPQVKLDLAAEPHGLQAPSLHQAVTANGRGGQGQVNAPVALGDRSKERLAAGASAVIGTAGFRTSAFDANDNILVPVDDEVGDLAAVRQRASGEHDARYEWRQQAARFNTESYARIHDNAFLDAASNPLSTFGVDVDTASYANVRRFLTQGTLPPPDAVRIEEMINYFPTTDAPPTDGRPFATYAEVARCPWMPSHQLVRIALKGREVAKEARPVSNLVFLIDVSGSMNEPNKLPLVKASLRKLVSQLGENDRVAMVVYAGSSGLALPSTSAMHREQILAAIEKLEAGGSTNGGQGIELAYATAQQNFVRGGVNRVLLCTDGDFNVGVTDRGQLTRLIEDKAKAGVFLSVLGFGTGNLKDDTMEQLADQGNGNYAYIDSDREGEKVLVQQISGTLVTIAKDVKLQLEFNPALVKSYRLIGYENRVLAKEDFNNDLKDAGDIGAGHSVVALYEIEPATGATGQGRLSGPASEPAKVDDLKYQAKPTLTTDAQRGELLTLKLRFKRPDAPLAQGTSELIETTLAAGERSIEQTSPDFRFASAVAGFGMLLRESPHRGEASWDMVAKLAEAGVGPDAGGHRAEFMKLVERARSLKPVAKPLGE